MATLYGTMMADVGGLLFDLPFSDFLPTFAPLVHSDMNEHQKGKQDMKRKVCRHTSIYV